MIRIFHDAGHGGKDPGATGNGLKEKDLTLKLSQYFGEILRTEYSNVIEKASRVDDRFLNLATRSNMANEWGGADYIISFHVNSANGKARGFESFIYNGSTPNTTENYRTIIHDEIMKVNNLFDRGKKKANFHMVRETRMDAVLTENGFIDNSHDAHLLKDNDYLYEVAKAHARGIAKIFSLNPKGKPEPSTGNKKYEVIGGTFSSKENALRQAEKVRKVGVESYVKKTWRLL